MNELQTFNLSRYNVYSIQYPEDNLYDKECMYQIHDYLLNDKIDSKILVSAGKRGVLRKIKQYCTRYVFIQYNQFYLYRKTIQVTLHLNKNAYMDYTYNEEHVW